MTLVVELRKEVETFLYAEAERKQRPVEEIAAERLSEAYGFGETEDETVELDAAAVEAILKGLEDIKAGRTISLEEYTTQMRARHAARRAQEKIAAL